MTRPVLNGIGVISRTSSRQYKKTTKPLPVIARELGVDYVLEGTIRWVKNGTSQRIRITPQLIRVSGDVELWADNIDRTLEDIFAVQTEIATRVVNSMDLVLSESEKRAISIVSSKNLDAYQAYLQGLSYSNRIERPNLDIAIKLLGRAVELDSTFALAYAELGYTHLYYYWFGFDRTPDRIATAKSCIDRAFALQGELPEAYLSLGYYYYFANLDYDRALEAFATAGRKRPNYDRALEATAYVKRRQGNFDGAVELLKRVFDLDPQNAIIPLEIGNTLRMVGRYAEAEGYLDKAIALLPDASDAYTWKAMIDLLWHGDTGASRRNFERAPKEYERWDMVAMLDVYDRNYQAALDRLSRAPASLYLGNFSIVPVSQMRGQIFRYMGDSARSRASFDSARALLESELKTRPDDYRIHQSLGIVLAGLGREEEAVREARIAVEKRPLSKDAWDGVWPVINLIQVYVMAGMNDAAIAEMEHLMSLRVSKELTPPLLRLDPMYDPLRKDPRFQALASRNAD